MLRVHPVLAAVFVLGFALFVFHRVRIEYASRGRLTGVSMALQFMVFFFHGLASYSFLDTRMPAILEGSYLRPVAVTLMVAGLVVALGGMAQLTLGDTLGRTVKGLRKSGIYRFSRNPQLVAYLAFLAGYVLLRPVWLGLAWLALYAVIAHVMVLVEEGHLHRVWGQEYRDYCLMTPRYLGLPKRA